MIHAPKNLSIFFFLFDFRNIASDSFDCENLNDLKNVLANLEEELEEKLNKLKELAGDTVLKGEEFKKYVDRLKGRTVVYKQKRAELLALKSEHGILSRTLEILSSKEEEILKALVISIFIKLKTFLFEIIIINSYTFFIKFSIRKNPYTDCSDTEIRSTHWKKFLKKHRIWITQREKPWKKCRRWFNRYPVEFRQKKINCRR